jgi:carboxyl-terminal processing protease
MAPLATLLLALAACVPASPETPEEWLDEIWSTARAEIYPPALAAAFTEERRLEIAGRAHSLDELVDALDPFLTSLGVSHTGLYDDRRDEFAFFAALFTYHDLDRPERSQLGVQWGPDGTVRAVLDGSPAERADVREGDRLLEVDGAPFASTRQWQGRSEVALTFERGTERRTVPLQPVRAGAQRAFLDATLASEKVYDCSGTRVGYFRLWTGTDDAFLEALEAAVMRFEGTTDALILDLRDGYGGAWLHYLRPFFADANGFAVAQIHRAEGEPETFAVDPWTNPQPYRKPMVALINGGTRSGKESLAYQLKKSARATLLGTRTAGAFHAGKGIFASEGSPLLLYLSVAEYRLDGNRIEGVGVPPDVELAGDTAALVERALALLAPGGRC